MVSASPTTSSDLLQATFRTAAQAQRSVLIPYLTAGYPRLADTARLLATLAENGADIIELGVPFSDPVADGPTIQRSSQLALEQGASLAWTLEQLRQFRTRYQTPVVVFSYLNPILRYGWQRFVDDAHAAGAQGVLLTDLPVGGDPELEHGIEASPLALIRLIAPTTSPERVSDIAERAQGFIYYIARLGVTGARQDLPPELQDAVRAVRARSKVPVVVGFGVAQRAHVEAISAVADGVVVGSALIDAIERGGTDGAAAFMRSLRSA